MKELRIFKESDKEKIYVKDSEELSTQGIWKQTSYKFILTRCKLLKYESYTYNYYIYEHRGGIHTIFRKKK